MFVLLTCIGRIIAHLFAASSASNPPRFLKYYIIWLLHCKWTFVCILILIHHWHSQFQYGNLSPTFLRAVDTRQQLCDCYTPRVIHTQHSSCADNIEKFVTTIFCFLLLACSCKNVEIAMQNLTMLWWMNTWAHYPVAWEWIFKA